MSPDAKKSQAGGESQLDYVHMYYAHQYERMTKLEDQRLTVTNIVITLSVLAISVAVSSSQTLTLLASIEIHVLIMLANLFAIFYIWRTLQYVRVHQDRAKAALEHYAPDLAELDKATPMPPGFKRLGLGNLQLLIHAVFILLAVVSIYLRFMSG
jgi:hypothetical protein